MSKENKSFVSKFSEEEVEELPKHPFPKSSQENVAKSREKLRKKKDKKPTEVIKELSREQIHDHQEISDLECARSSFL